MLEFVYAYTDLQATKDKKIKIIGGKSWYKLPLHLPLLDIVSDKQGKQYYHVAIPSREDVKQLIQPIDDRILDAYIPVSEQLVEEIWISSRELDNWKSLLRPLYKIRNKSFSDAKREFIHILKQETKLLGSNIHLKNRLPVREHTPFRQYTKGEILNMPRCEFSRLVKWIESFHGLITRLTSDPTYKVEYELRPYSDSQCPRVSDKGRNFKRLRLKLPKPLGPSDEYRYDHHFRWETIYSIPIDFLP